MAGKLQSPRHRLWDRPRCVRLMALRHGWATVERVPQAQQRSMPYISFSQSKRDCTALDVALLLQAAHDPTLSQGSRAKAGHFRHWQALESGPLRERLLQKITRAVDRSVAVVAAFTNHDVYEPALSSDAAHQAQNTDDPYGLMSGGGSAVPAWNWSLHGSSRSQRKRSLIGFARAAGDSSLAVTIYDLAVHPEFRRYGVGAKLLKVLTQQLYYKEVYDIGSVVPRDVQPFFRRCSFEEDRENSTTLTFLAHHQWRQDGLVQGLLPADGWLVDPAWLPAPGAVIAPGVAGRRRSRSPRGYPPGSDSESDDDYRSHSPSHTTAYTADQGVLLPIHSVGTGGEGGAGGSCGDAWERWSAYDCLARVPAPATEALRENTALQELLRAKLDKAVPDMSSELRSEGLSGRCEASTDGLEYHL